MLASAIVDRCEARYGDPTNQIVSAAEWLEHVNEVYMETVMADPNWPFLEDRDTSLTVTSSGEVSLPADVWRVTGVYNATDKIPLAPIPGQAQFRHYFPDPANGLGIPLYYRLRSNTLEVYPRPATTTSLELDVLVPPAALTSGDEPVFPEEYHRILIVGALAKAYEDDENLEMAAHYQGRFDRGLAAMKVNLLQTRTEGFPQVVDDF
jgi:hypothetical protein